MPAVNDPYDAYQEYLQELYLQYQWRRDLECKNCGHLGSEHDLDEVAECQACGCAAGWWSNYS